MTIAGRRPARWAPPGVGAPYGRVDRQHMIVWGGSTPEQPVRPGGGRYDVATDTWQPVTSTGAPSGRYAATACGRAMSWWCGAVSGRRSCSPTAAATTRARTAGLRSPPATTARPAFGHTALWNGSEMIVWGGAPDIRPMGSSATMAAGTIRCPTVGSHEPDGRSRGQGSPLRRLDGHRDDRLGRLRRACCSDPLFSGGRYDPTTDEWQATQRGRRSVRSVSSTLPSGPARR